MISPADAIEKFTVVVNGHPVIVLLNQEKQWVTRFGSFYAVFNELGTVEKTDSTQEYATMIMEAAYQRSEIGRSQVWASLAK